MKNFDGKAVQPLALVRICFHSYEFWFLNIIILHMYIVITIWISCLPAYIVAVDELKSHACFENIDWHVYQKKNIFRLGNWRQSIPTTIARWSATSIKVSQCKHCQRVPKSHKQRRLRTKKKNYFQVDAFKYNGCNVRHSNHSYFFLDYSYVAPCCNLHSGTGDRAMRWRDDMDIEEDVDALAVAQTAPQPFKSVGRDDFVDPIALHRTVYKPIDKKEALDVLNDFRTFVRNLNLEIDHLLFLPEKNNFCAWCSRYSFE